MNTHAHMSLGCSPIMQLKPTSIVCLLHTYVMYAHLRLYDYTGPYESSLLAYAIKTKIDHVSTTHCFVLTSFGETAQMYCNWHGIGYCYLCKED